MLLLSCQFNHIFCGPKTAQKNYFSHSHFSVRLGYVFCITSWTDDLLKHVKADFWPEKKLIIVLKSNKMLHMETRLVIAFLLDLYRIKLSASGFQDEVEYIPRNQM